MSLTVREAIRTVAVNGSDWTRVESADAIDCVLIEPRSEVVGMDYAITA
jgi:hypothetical protein